MNDRKQEAINALRNIVTGEAVTFPATVKSVDLVNASCVVETAEGLTFYDVRLRSVVDGSGNGLVVYPTSGSPVLVGRIGKSNQLYVIASSKVDYFTLKTENESLKLILSDLLDAIGQITVPTPAGASGVPVNVAAFTAIKQRLELLLKD